MDDRVYFLMLVSIVILDWFARTWRSEFFYLRFSILR
jgi:hypothetical protein